MTPLLTGRLRLWAGGGVHLGASTASRLCAHRAVQLTLALGAPFGVRSAAAAPWQDCTAVLIPPNQFHEIQGGTDPLATIYLDPASVAGRAAAERVGQEPWRALPESDLGTVHPALRGAAADPAINPVPIARALVLRMLGGPSRQYPQSRRVQRAVEAVHADPGRSVHLEEVARLVGRSPLHFGHLFAAEMGLPFRRYVLWMRLAEALRLLSKGEPLARVARRTDFPSAAHADRAFRRLFGAEPQVLLGGAGAPRGGAS